MNFTDEEKLNSAREINESSFIFDAHFDLAIDLDNRREFGERGALGDIHLEKLRAGGVKCLVSSIFIESEFLPEMALRKALDQISSLKSEVDARPDDFALCGSISEVDAAVAAGKIAIMISLEGVEPIGNDLRLLRIFRELGVRALGLTWSRRNYAADGCYFSPKAEGKKGGLTAFGVELVDEAVKSHMMIDVSHLNDEGFYDIAEIVKGPFVASHSNCRDLTYTMRNLTDDQIKTIASHGGVIGMNGCSSFVDVDGGEQTALGLMRHADRIIKLVGDDYVGIGLDCCDKTRYLVNGPSSVASFDVVEDHSHMAEITTALLDLGYGRSTIYKILGGNFHRVYKEVLDC